MNANLESEQKGFRSSVPLSLEYRLKFLQNKFDLRLEISGELLRSNPRSSRDRKLQNPFSHPLGQNCSKMDTTVKNII